LSMSCALMSYQNEMSRPLPCEFAVDFSNGVGIVLHTLCHDVLKFSVVFARGAVVYLEPRAPEP
jgi:hypothetical protein